MIPKCKKKDDSGWIDLALKDGVSTSSIRGINQVPQYRKIGNHVFIRGHVAATWDGTNTIPVAVVPYNPKKNIYKFTTLSGTNIARIFANADGTLAIEWIKKITDGSNETTAKTWISLDIDFWID